MKQIQAYIQPYMLDKVVAALKKIHIRGMSVMEVKGFGREKDLSYPHHYADDTVTFTPKIKIEVACSDADADKIVEAIQLNARTGRKGDGKIFITQIDRAVSILSGATGDAAI